MSRFIVTFGQRHVHSVDGKTIDKDCVAVVKAENYEAGRKKAFEIFGDKWHNFYEEEKFDQMKTWDGLPVMNYFRRGKIEVKG